MKPGMQRDILVVCWLLFDEFAGEDCDAQPPSTPEEPPAKTEAKQPTASGENKGS